MSIRIYTLTHKNFEIPKDPMYVPLQVGRATKDDLGYLCDNTGDNISEKNCYYSELTGIYWIWNYLFFCTFNNNFSINFCVYFTTYKYANFI